MTPVNIVRILNRIRPKRIEDLKGKIAYRAIGIGAFRAAYVLDNQVVIKFPISWVSWGCRRHAQREIAAIRRIQQLKKMKHLRRYIPKVYYMDYSNGVIVMDRLCRKSGSGETEFTSAVERMFQDSFSRRTCDIYFQNMGQDLNGNWKLFDLGIVY